ncbi:MAG TPA: Tat pathway signal sequence domain protein, partial [Caulobacteraceae bacterium]
KNSGPCPYVKVLYDAGRYEEFKGGEEASAAVAYTGEIESLSADCAYKGLEPIHNKIAINFALGRGPQGLEARKTYRYWIAVTHRNKSVLAKEYFTLPVTFTAGKDRIGVVDTINDIVIPRANSKVSGENFEILVGFDVTPEMADFNRLGKRFRVNAGGPQVAEAQTSGR